MESTVDGLAFESNIDWEIPQTPIHKFLHLVFFSVKTILVVRLIQERRKKAKKTLVLKLFMDE